jgi:ABC-type transport system substrate-binding protein
MKGKKFSRRDFLKISAATGLGMVASSCTPSETATPEAVATEVPPEVVEQVLNWGENTTFNSWNAWTMSSVNDSIHNIVYSRLIWKDSDGNIYPDLADEWTVADDGLSMTLNLNPDAKWHDGNPVVAGDFVEMFGYHDDPEMADNSGVQKLWGLLRTIENMEAVDDKTLKLMFPQPVPYIYTRLFKTLAMGSGPFKMVEFKENEFTRFERYGDYFGDPAILDEVVIKKLSDDALVPNLESGAIDCVKRLNTAQFDYVKGLADFDVLINEGSGNINNIVVNTLLPPLDDNRVRQAISHALDRQGIIDNVYYGIGEPTCAPFYSPASIAYREDLVNLYPFDLDKARSLLDDAGVGAIELSIVGSPGFPEWTLAFQIWQADLAKIDVTLNIVEVELTEFYEIARMPDLDGNNLAGWGTGRTKRDPAIFFQTQQQYFGGPAGSDYVNPFGWVSEDMNDAVVAAMVERDPDKRSELYQTANEILTVEQPMINYRSNPQLVAYNTKVEGLEADLLGFWMYDNVKIKA